MAGLPDTVGLFGLGLIGHALAMRLIAAKVDVWGYDPDPAATMRFSGIGGQAKDAAGIWEADCILSAVFSTDQLAELVEAAPDTNKKTIVSLSTCDPDLMPAIGLAAAKQGYDLIEAPISGTSADLANGEAILMVAGDAAIAKNLAPLFDILVRTHYHVGDIGSGNRAKLAVNLVLGLSRAAVAEGVVFAKAVGLEPASFLELALDSAASSKVMASKGPKMVARDFSALGRVNQCAKDFELIYAQALQAGQGLPMSERYLEVIRRSLAAGEGELDNSALFLEIERTKVPEPK